ncbi:16S rRNA (guanine(966)-N(2))-methyltransferase RsmD [Malonomonas rubra DSM 5091]|uniref:16S rRNA (Guanine(966)-N(2))-methyltransferase RsmD n=1 Tax=Malonomonas rubra DSM 5091 TaxID=1122189 RepID=A0A1M6K8K3_MALRU|nr:16S rRNA (guanine(966)-N(2))-methyltransferase RsmD [Malonomonas rubra]SHJ55187.1 16S rRNA (guanine(966)-N(2))-methyltransferase RsmD [Malonomonas rubra DSM 5091]
MRIISGTARGRQLAAFVGSGIRPTPDRVREALFSILQSRLGTFHGLKILELFAGSGAQSLEALSRGADSAIAVDSSAQSCKLIKENAQRCKLEDRLQIVRQDVFAALSQVSGYAPFDLILLDPPYNKQLIPRALQEIETLQLLSEDGIICAESASNEVIDDCGKLTLIASRKYGSSTIHLFSWNED